MATLHRTIVRPIITERSSANFQDRGEYTFEVASDATKHSIKEAVERLFNVKVTDVHTMIVRGRMRRMGRGYAKTKNWKKAIVSVKDGDTIEFFEGA